MIASRNLRAAAVAVACAAGLWQAACASSGNAVPRPFPVPGGPPPARVSPPAGIVPPPAGAPDGYAISGAALALRGAPYRNGGADPHGFDCSGFTQYVYSEFGVALPRQVRDQFGVGTKVRADQLEPGDLLFFTTDAPGASHVAIAIGGDQFVHAPSTNGVVRVERLSTPYWRRRFLGARRIEP
jgi:cell wall-associated NlpC family hydrolase